MFQSVVIIDPKKFDRKSLTNTNCYNEIIDATWKDYPKRKNSAICTTSETYPATFGSIYRVIPFDGSKWAKCPKYDLWFAFDFVKEYDCNHIQCFFTNLDNLRTNILQQSSNIGEKKQNIINLKKLNFDELKIEINELFNMIKSWSEDELWDGISEYWLDEKLTYSIRNKENFFDYIVSEMEPEKNGFELLDYKDLNSIHRNPVIEDNVAEATKPNSREIWTESKCLLIETETFEELFPT